MTCPVRDLRHAGDTEVVGESGSAVEATSRIPALRPHVVVLDARLPDGDGVEVCRAVRSVDPAIQALIPTSYEDDEALFAAIMAGAAGYVLQQIRGTDLVDAARRVAAGQSLLDPAVTARVLDRIRHGVGAPDALAGLTSSGTGAEPPPDGYGTGSAAAHRHPPRQPGTRRLDVGHLEPAAEPLGPFGEVQQPTARHRPAHPVVDDGQGEPVRRDA
ncbi:response regulator transcription factor [Longispora urticae]